MNRLEVHSISGWVRSGGDAAGRRRVELWRENLCALHPGLSLDWLTTAAVRARFANRAFATARFTDISNVPTRVSYRPRAGATDDYRLALQLTGTGRYWHAGRESGHKSADLVLLDGRLPFDVDYLSTQRVLVWTFPRQMLEPLLAEPERAVGTRIAGYRGAGALLSGYARALARSAGAFDPAAQPSLALHLCGLTALALNGPGPGRFARRLDWRVARRQQILSYVEAHFRDPGLTGECAAGALGMSRRWLYALLDEAPTSFSALLTGRRLEECMRLLSDSARDHLTIAEIAFACGFNDLSTFNRRFRARYAMTPRDARQNAARHREGKETQAMRVSRAGR